jgi:tRNA A-37 threonylcarbamoyl transferase component Bud32/tetratricopeptide (TPR) repeat protein
MHERGPRRDTRHSDRSTGRYEIREVLAAGGMGTVHRCYDRLGQRLLAYKRLKLGEDATRSRMVALFQREYDTLVRLPHPNIVEVYDYGFDAEGPYYTMELLVGSDLRSLAPLSFREGCRLLRDVASALALLHARRLVHRDLSPSNVRLTVDGTAKLIDFGALTHFGHPTEIVGTPVFVAPECLLGAPLDQRTDLYALGALAYWTFTRHTHLRARALEDLPDAWNEPVAPPSTHVLGLPRELDDLVLSLLRHDPVARPATAADVIERLTSLASLSPERDEAKVAYSYAQHPPLIGRSEPIATLQHALRSAIGGVGQIVWVEAERGLGRSALLDRTAVDAQLAGATMVRVDGAMHTAAFSTARQLVEVGLATFPEVVDKLARRPAHSTPGGEHGGPSTKRRDTVRSAIDASERQAAISSALAEVLLAISLRNPLVLLVDDAQLADSESLALLASLISAVRRHPVLLVLSAPPRRAEERDEPSARLSDNATHCRLAPLSESELQEVISSVFGGVPNCQRLARWLHTQTGGNPGHALDVARLLLSRGTIRYTVGTFVLPYEYEANLAENDHAEARFARLAGIGELARQIAGLLALHDGPLQPEQLASALRVDVPAVLTGLEELVARSAAVSNASQFTCTSEALRAAIVRRLSDDQTRNAHVALARALGERDAHSLEGRLSVARHLLRADASEQLEGAHLVAEIGDAHRFEIAMMAGAHATLEQALTVLKAHGLSDRECVGVLVPLSLAGFYGSLEMQRRYLDRTLDMLSILCGLSLARRLTPFTGPRLALLLGMSIAFWRFVFAKKVLNRRSFAENLLAFTSIMGPATAAAASSYDADESFRVADYCQPFIGAPKRSGLYCIREFCLATAELIDGRMGSSSRRYAYVLETFKRPVLGMDDVLREQASLGCLHGRAQALVTDGSREALTLADELIERGAFFTPHAECVRMTYFANRGESEPAAAHRERSEAYALKGGTSWSSLCTLMQRSMQAYTLTRDVVSLVRVVADLQRLAKLSRSMAALAELGHANLEQLRGRPQQAVLVYERVLDSHVGRMLPTYPIDRALHAQALSAMGEHAQAKAVCLALLEGPVHSEFRLAHLLPRQKLALAEAGLGDHARAIELLDECLHMGASSGNPLTLGSLHRDRALLAASIGDAASFVEHAAHMQRHFEATRNPLLIQQCDGLRLEAVKLGLLAANPKSAAAEARDAITELATQAEVVTSPAFKPA